PFLPLSACPPDAALPARPHVSLSHSALARLAPIGLESLQWQSSCRPSSRATSIAAFTCPSAPKDGGRSFGSITNIVSPPPLRIPLSHKIPPFQLDLGPLELLRS